MPTTLLINGRRKTVFLPNDRGTNLIFREVLLYDCYGLEQLSRPIRTVLDIGANVGIFCVAARNAFPLAVIHAYEPNPDLEQFLRIQAAATRCVYFPEAVGAEAGTVTLEAPGLPGHARARPDPSGQIPCIPLGRAIERLGGSVDLAKVDCEGAEWSIFQDQEAWRHIQNLSMEYHLWPDHTHEQVIATLGRLGFSIRRYIPSTQTGLIIASRLTHQGLPTRPEVA